jgi:hypothetical protein
MELMGTTPHTLELHGHRRSAGSGRARIWWGMQRDIDRVAVERAARELLVALGADLDDDGLRDTPRRMAGTGAAQPDDVARRRGL